MTQETDRELLEWAAKAAGLTWRKSDGLWVTAPFLQTYWNPLTDDGDALRLAVKLNMEVASRNEYSRADVIGKPTIYVNHGWGEYVATRHAIVRAAAEIGKQMGENT